MLNMREINNLPNPSLWNENFRRYHNLIFLVVVIKCIILLGETKENITLSIMYLYEHLQYTTVQRIQNFFSRKIEHDAFRKIV